MKTFEYGTPKLEIYGYTGDNTYNDWGIEYSFNFDAYAEYKMPVMSLYTNENDLLVNPTASVALSSPNWI